ncbi:MAG TPA: FAD-binding oxidoreductase [Candidatus Eisenbacteria bacterium]|nr:FAD-binding oxidoreductase [Candidatus Eisenbacteria bacterium]
MTRDVVIVGAGVAGVSIAEHVLRYEPDLSVLLIDAHHVGAGSTSRSLAAFRHQWSVPAHVAFSRYSGEEYERLAGLGYPLEFRRNGYLFLYTDPDRFRHATDRAARQREQGVAVEAFGVDGLDPARIPCASWIEDSGLVGFTWGPRDGFLDPLAVAQAYLDEARRRGLDYRPGAKPGALHTAGDAVIGITVEGTRIDTRRVVLAAGIWSASIAAGWGLTIPLVAAKRYIYHSRPIRELDVSLWPLVIGDRGQHCRPAEGNTLMLSWELKPPAREVLPGPETLWEEQDAIDAGYGASEYGLEVLEEMSRHVPVLAETVSLRNATCGWYGNTADAKAILGPDPRLAGLYLATGFSGHGIMHGGATGRVMADLMLDRPERLLTEAELAGFSIEPLLAGRVRDPVEEMSL